MAGNMNAGLLAASQPDVGLIVCDAGTDAYLVPGLRHAVIPCPVVLRHDLSRRAIEALYGVSRLDADIRPSFRGYDDLRAHLAGTTAGIEENATREILRRIAPAPGSRLREFVAVMAVLGERPVLQGEVARSLMMSPSSFRTWLASVRRGMEGLPSFPRLNAHFVALHLLWRRERLGWSGKRAAAVAGFGSDKTCANYLGYHLAATGGQLLRSGGFDARMTAAKQLFATGARDGGEAVRRI
jgi:hypothetical protein